MEFRFFKEWKQFGAAIKVGPELMKKIMSQNSMKDLGEPVEEVFPPEIPDDGGHEIERYPLSANFRHLWGKDLSEILMGEFHKKIKQETKTLESSSDKTDKTNEQVIVDLLSFIVNEEITHFTFG